MATFSFVEFMREGGWGMWPVLILGLVGLASSTYRPASLWAHLSAPPSNVSSPPP